MSYQNQSSAVVLPTETTTATIPASSAVVIDLSDFIGSFVSIKVDVPCAVRAGATSAVTATATDYPLDVNVTLGAYVTHDRAYVALCGLGEAGTAYVARSSV